MNEFEKLSERMRQHIERRDAEIERLTREGVDHNAHVRERAAVSWHKNGLEHWVKRNYDLTGAWCGYVRFPVRPVKDTGYRGILTYVPVHGGITWAQRSPDYSFVYGFDCNHVSDQVPNWHADFSLRLKRFSRTGKERDLMPTLVRRTLRWLMRETEIMAAGIRCAARVEDDYLAVKYPEDLHDNPDMWSVVQKTQWREANLRRASIIDQYHRYMRDEGFAEFDLSNNIGAALNLLGGRL